MGLELVRLSDIYETAPWGGIDQPAYLNQLLILDTNVTPHELLKICLEVEQSLGRERDRKWDKRTIDIDIIYYNDWVIISEDLKIPHPYRSERNFILKMLVDLDAEFIDPIYRCPIQELADNCSDILEVKLIS